MLAIYMQFWNLWILCCVEVYNPLENYLIFSRLDLLESNTEMTKWIGNGIKRKQTNQHKSSSDSLGQKRLYKAVKEAIENV